MNRSSSGASGRADEKAGSEADAEVAEAEDSFVDDPLNSQLKSNFPVQPNKDYEVDHKKPAFFPAGQEGAASVVTLLPASCGNRVDKGARRSLATMEKAATDMVSLWLPPQGPPDGHARAPRVGPGALEDTGHPPRGAPRRGRPLGAHERAGEWALRPVHHAAPRHRPVLGCGQGQCHLCGLAVGQLDKQRRR